MNQHRLNIGSQRQSHTLHTDRMRPILRRKYDNP